MITKFFIDLLFGIILWLVNLFPTADAPPTGVMASFSAVAPLAAMAWRYFPMVTLASAFSLALYLETSILGAKLSIWIWNKLRGSG